MVLKGISKMSRDKKQKTDNQIEKELVAIKRLLVVLLLKIDTSQSELSLALEMDKADVSRMLPARKIKSILNKVK